MKEAPAQTFAHLLTGLLGVPGGVHRLPGVAAHRVHKVLAAHDGACFEETCNLLDAWLSVMPGNGADSLRRLDLLEIHAAGTNVRRSRISSSSRGQRRRWLAARLYCRGQFDPLWAHFWAQSGGFSPAIPSEHSESLGISSR